ncbi:MAG: hypothetical protein LBJ96_04810 [Holosporaceae bacterium]|jgi:hypothetical protein|nr:hypothetical protein [Holosporaceae bacterium]
MPLSKKISATGFSNFFRRRSASKAVITLEAALTLPAICYLVFFLLEMVKINITQTAVETIAAECTFEFIANGNATNFTTIISKYRPAFIPSDNLRYWIRLYVKNGTTEGLAYMCATSPYGGEEIYWPDDNFGNRNDNADFMDTDKTNTILAATNYLGVTDYANKRTLFDNYLAGDPNTPGGTAFVLTFVVDFPFSSPFIRMLFSGGSNTKKNGGGGARGSKYLLWGRGVGIVNDTTTLVTETPTTPT